MQSQKGKDNGQARKYLLHFPRKNVVITPRDDICAAALFASRHCRCSKQPIYLVSRHLFVVTKKAENQISISSHFSLILPGTKSFLTALYIRIFIRNIFERLYLMFAVFQGGATLIERDVAAINTRT